MLGKEVGELFPRPCPEARQAGSATLVEGLVPLFGKSQLVAQLNKGNKDEKTKVTKKRGTPKLPFGNLVVPQADFS